jgi:hypothetical protein
MDYFIGCTKDQVPYLPINVRQTLISIRNDGDDNGVKYIAPFEYDEYKILYKYKIFKSLNINFKYVPQTQITTQIQPYADCGERTLLNMFNYFLLDEEGNILIRESWNERLKIFYSKWNNINKISNKGTMQEMKNDFAKVIENIPEFNNTNFYANHTYNIRPNLENIIKICKFLLNLDGEITIKNILINLDSNIEEDDIKLYNCDAYFCIEYKKIVIKLNIGHAEFKFSFELKKNGFLSYIYNDFFENFARRSNVYTYELCLFAVNRDEKNIFHVPYDLRTPEIRLLAFQKNVLNFKYLPHDSMTPEICLSSVQKDVRVFKDVPLTKRSLELCLLAVQKDEELIEVFEYIPDDIKKNPEFYLEAFKRNKNIFKVLDDSYKSPEMCLEAVKQDPNLFNFVPPSKKTNEIINLWNEYYYSIHKNDVPVDVPDNDYDNPDQDWRH